MEPCVKLTEAGGLELSGGVMWPRCSVVGAGNTHNVTCGVHRAEFTEITGPDLTEFGRTTAEPFGIGGGTNHRFIKCEIVSHDNINCLENGSESEECLLCGESLACFGFGDLVDLGGVGIPGDRWV
jgi:hypothetical protein